MAHTKRYATDGCLQYFYQFVCRFAPMCNTCRTLLFTPCYLWKILQFRLPTASRVAQLAIFAIASKPVRISREGLCLLFVDSLAAYKFTPDVCGMNKTQ